MKKTIWILCCSLVLSMATVFAYNTVPEEDLLTKAHLFAYESQITTVQSLSRFRPELNLNRAQAAKMAVMFGRTYLGDNYFFRPDKTIDCSFSDRWEISRDLRSYVIESCRFGIFAWGKWQFEPLGRLTVWQAKIVIKRITWRESVQAGTGIDNDFITRWDFVKLMYLEYEKLLGNK